MVSDDNGRSWIRRSTIATAPAGDNSDEPVIDHEPIGRVGLRDARDVGQGRPMFLMHSKDNGMTWSQPQELFDFGVFPRLLQLENGVLVLSFGRPGVWLSFSLDGGHSWTEKQAVLKGSVLRVHVAVGLGQRHVPAGL